jgi:hypothetical protein
VHDKWSSFWQQLMSDNIGECLENDLIFEMQERQGALQARCFGNIDSIRQVRLPCLREEPRSQIPQVL